MTLRLRVESLANEETALIVAELNPTPSTQDVSFGVGDNLQDTELVWGMKTLGTSATLTIEFERHRDAPNMEWNVSEFPDRVEYRAQNPESGSLGTIATLHYEGKGEPRAQLRSVAGAVGATPNIIILPKPTCPDDTGPKFD